MRATRAASKGTVAVDEDVAVTEEVDVCLSKCWHVQSAAPSSDPLMSDFVNKGRAVFMRTYRANMNQSRARRAHAARRARRMSPERAVTVSHTSLKWPEFLRDHTDYSIGYREENAAA